MSTDSESSQDEKKSANIGVATIKPPPSESHPSTTPPQDARPWRTTFLRGRPLAGLAALGLIVCCMLANLGVLLASNHSPTSSWKYSPSTFLAIMTAVANLALRYACFQGVIIAWWSHASAGSTIKNLHKEWLAGSTIHGALSAGRGMGLVGLACIFATLGAIDGPLLQRASQVTNAPIAGTPVQLRTSMVPEIPRGFTGYWGITSNGGANNLFNATVPTSDGGLTKNNIVPGSKVAFEREVRVPYLSDAPITGAVSGCDGTCKLQIRAPALAVKSCQTTLLPVDYNKLPDEFDAAVLPLDWLGYFAYIGLLVDGESEQINLISGYSQTQDCKGTLNYTVCTLEPAVGDYNVTVHDNQITLDPNTPDIVAMASNTAVNQSTAPGGSDSPVPVHESTLGGIVDLAVAKWVSLSAFMAGGHSKITQSFSAQEYQLPGEEGCTQWRDPMPDMLRNLNELMFRTGIAASSLSSSALESSLDPDQVTNATVLGHNYGQQSVFTTNFYYYLGAALLESLCIFLILPTYWGYWRLGRSVSFSPLEIAKAFDAPLLQGSDVNASGGEIAKSHGDTQVRYGATSASSVMVAGGIASPTSARAESIGGEKICFAESRLVRRPTNGSMLAA